MHKKRFLRLVSAVLALCMMAALLPTAAFADAATSNEFLYTHQGQTLKYTVNADGTTVSVAKPGWDAVSDDVVIPETFEHDEKTYTVTSIGELAFYYCISMTSVVIPTSVTSIGNSAFYNCSTLTSVTFDKNSQLTSIGYSAFVNCSKLKSVEIPSGVTSIESNTFDSCSALKKVTFAENSQLTSIGNNAFANCSALTSVEIPEGVKTIGQYVFQRCDALEEVTIPASVTSVKSNIFDSCTTAKKITYGGSQEQWDNFGVKLPEGSTVICTWYTVEFDSNGYGTAPEKSL